MLRRAKDDKKTPPADAPEEAEPSPEEPDDQDDRLAPLEEFRGKADQWMKETAAQLARVATHVQQDEKRQSKLDQRLAEFEDRIQSMLMLTEALSVGDNPFVKSHADEKAPPQETASLSSKHPPLALSDEPRGDGPPVWDAEEEGEAGPTLIRLGVDDGPVPPEATEEPKQAPLRGHPNDPSLESYAPDEETEEALTDAELARRIEEEEGSPFAEPTPPAPPVAAEAIQDSPPLDSDRAADAERRLMLLQWASLLSRNMHRIDIDAFLETYLHTGWVRPDDVERVRALAADLNRHAGPPTARLDREELHVRTILLISRLTASGNGKSRAQHEERTPKEILRGQMER